MTLSIVRVRLSEVRHPLFWECYSFAWPRKHVVMNHDMAIYHMQVQSMNVDSDQSAVVALSLLAIPSIRAAVLQQKLQSCRSAMALSYVRYCLNLGSPFFGT